MAITIAVESPLQPEVRELIAHMGLKNYDDLIGATENLDQKTAIEHWKAKGLDFSRIFHQPAMPASVARKHVDVQDVSQVAWHVFNNTDPRRDTMFADGPMDAALAADRGGEHWMHTRHAPMLGATELRSCL